MVLLHVLHRLAPRYRWKLKIAHLNHQLRGRSSEGDERLVRRTAQHLGLPVVVERADVRSLAKTEHLSMEMAARKARHEFLARAAVQGRAPTIASAHHADDQLELFFLRLLRGSGSDGLTGMKWCNPSPANPNLQLVRPLLAQPKAVLREFARKEKVAFHEDATNASLDIQRNRVRHELLPLLRGRYQPALADVVARVIEITSAEADFARNAASDWLRAGGKEGSGLRVDADEISASQPRKVRGSRAISSPAFDELPVAVQRRTLQAQLLTLRVNPEFELIEHLRLKPGKPVCIARSGVTAPKKTQAPIALLRDSAGLVHVRPTGSSVFNTESLEVSLDAKVGAVTFSGVCIKWRSQQGRISSPAKPPLGSEFFDADLVGSHILLRHWLPGDRFQPIGMSGSVKLQDFLTNQKVPRDRRRQLLLALTAAGEVFWVEGSRISDRFKLTPNTIRRLHWAWQRL